MVCGVCAFLFHRERGKNICREKDLEQNETTQRERERERERERVRREREMEKEQRWWIQRRGLRFSSSSRKKNTKKSFAERRASRELEGERALFSLLSVSLSSLSPAGHFLLLGLSHPTGTPTTTFLTLARVQKDRGRPGKGKNHGNQRRSKHRRPQQKRRRRTRRNAELQARQAGLLVHGTLGVSGDGPVPDPAIQSVGWEK